MNNNTSNSINNFNLINQQNVLSNNKLKYINNSNNSTTINRLIDRINDNNFITSNQTVFKKEMNMDNDATVIKNKILNKIYADKNSLFVNGSQTVCETNVSVKKSYNNSSPINDIKDNQQCLNNLITTPIKQESSNFMAINTKLQNQLNINNGNIVIEQQLLMNDDNRLINKCNNNLNMNELKQVIIDKQQQLENNNTQANMDKNTNSPSNVDIDMDKNNINQSASSSNSKKKTSKKNKDKEKRRTIKKVKTSDLLLTKISTSKIKRKKLRERPNLKTENSHLSNVKDGRLLSLKRTDNDKSSSKSNEQTIVDNILRTKKPRQNMIYLTEKILKHLHEYTELIINDLFDSLYVFNDRAKEFHLTNLKNFINSYGSVLARKLAKKVPYKNEMIKILIRVVKNKNEILAKSMKRNCITSNDFNFEFSLFLRKKKMEEIRDLFVFPFKGINSVVVTTDDEKRLISGKMFNDNLIEFCIKWLENDVLTNEQKKDVHFFNTFFFEQLYNRRSLTPEKMYESVKKWTSKVDIFDKKYIFIPINESMHWYLIMIYNPYAYLTKEDENKSIDGTKSSSCNTPILINIDKDINSNDAHLENDHGIQIDVDNFGENTNENTMNQNSCSNDTGNLSMSNNIENDTSLSLDCHKNVDINMNTTVTNHETKSQVNNSINSNSNSGKTNNDNKINYSIDTSDNSAVTTSNNINKNEKVDMDNNSDVNVINIKEENDDQDHPDKTMQNNGSIEIDKMDIDKNNNDKKYKIALNNEVQLGTKLRRNKKDTSETILINNKSKEGSKNSKVKRASKIEEESISDIDNEEQKENPNIKILLENAVRVREALNEVNLKYSNNSLERLRTFITKELALKMINFIKALIRRELRRNQYLENNSSKNSTSHHISSNNETKDNKKGNSLSQKVNSLIESINISEDYIKNNKLPTFNNRYFTRTNANPNVLEESYNILENINTNKEKPRKSLSKDNCYIVVFDSINGKHPTAAKIINSYLASEASHKKHIAIDKKIRCLYAKVPKQSNSLDCGVYLIKYIETFLQDPDKYMDMVLVSKKDDHEWFSKDSIKKKREDIRDLIIKLTEDYKLIKEKKEKMPSIKSEKK